MRAPRTLPRLLAALTLGGCGGGGHAPERPVPDHPRRDEAIADARPADAPVLDARPVDARPDTAHTDAMVCVSSPGLDSSYPSDAFAGSDSSPPGFTYLYRTYMDFGTAGHCAQHHIAPMPDLSARDLAYADMVNVVVPGTHCTLWYVHPGDPTHSILLGSLTGVGWPQMPPLPCSTLPPAAAAAVRAWIVAGAPNN